MLLCLSLQEMSGQQQTSYSESENDFPQDDSAFAASEFSEEGRDFTESSADTAARHSEAGGTSHVSGKRSLFDGYKDPSRQFSGDTRSYHQDARYSHSLIQLQFALHLLSSVWNTGMIIAVAGWLVCGRHYIRHHHLYHHSVNRHMWAQLYCQHQGTQTRSYHQDPSTVGGLTAEDIEKARESKRAAIKPHRQMVTFIPLILELHTNANRHWS